MFVPSCGYRIRLTAEWTFDLYHEHRCRELIEALGHKFEYDYRKPMVKTRATIPSGTVLQVERVYIRQQNRTAKSKDEACLSG